MKRKIGLCLILFAAAAIGVLATLLLNRSSASFSTSAFSQIVPGMTSVEVESILGRPKHRNHLPAGGEVWVFVESGDVVPDPLYVIEFDGTMHVSTTRIDDF